MVFPLKDGKGIKTINAFQKYLDESRLEPNKIWIDKGSECYNRPMKAWPQDSDIEVYSTHNEGKFVVEKKFIRIL